MKLKKRISLRIPGTSANLGPGFDIMGLALRIYNKFEFEFAENNDFSSLLENGTKPPFEPEDDLVLYSYKRYFETFLKGENPLPYKARMSLGLPIRGGLGSSASAAVAGFTSANYIHKKIFKSKKIPSKEEFLYELAMIEGHPDNTTPAFCGGLIFAYFTDEKKLHFFKRRFPGNISLLLFTPDFQTPTNDSRKKLPSEYPVKDVIYNMARVGTWMEFLRTKKFEHLLLALGDKLHTPFRIPNCDPLDKITGIVEEKKSGFSLSGSGPSVLIYLPKQKAKTAEKEFRTLFDDVMGKKKMNYILQSVVPDNAGTILKEI